MRANDRAVNDGADFVDLVLELAKDGLPVAITRPVGEAVVDGFPRTKSLRQISPRNTSFGAVEHGIDEEAVAPYRIRTPLWLRDNGS